MSKVWKVWFVPVLWFLACTAGCGQRLDDGGDAGSQDGGEDDTRDAGRDAGPDAFAFFDAGPDGGGDPAVWGVEHCGAAADRGRTGDPCTGNWACGTLDALVRCYPSGTLAVVHVEVPQCEAAASEPWSECTAALEGTEGQRCEGTWACAEVSTESGCCVEYALCNPPTFPGGAYPSERLFRARACDSNCVLAPTDDRPTWTDCPPRWTFGNPDPLPGDPCEGTWACMIGPEHFGQYPSGSDASALPVWCDGRVLHVSPSVAPIFFYEGACE